MLFGRSVMLFPRTIRGVRFNSTSSAPSAISKLTSKVNHAINKTTYWAKVFAEVSKQVYVKEGLAPPSLKEFETVYKKFYTTLLEYYKTPEKVIGLTSGLKFTKDNVYKYGSYGIQLVGLFSLGEIIGRVKVFGYPNYDEEHKH